MILVQTMFKKLQIQSMSGKPWISQEL